MNKRIKLVLSGSGTKFPVFIGAIRRLEEAGFIIEAVAGTSGGGIVAAALASGFSNSYKLEKMCKEFLPQANKFLKPSLTNFFSEFGFFNTKKLTKLFEKCLVPDINHAIFPLKIVTTNIDDEHSSAAKIWSSVGDAGASLPKIVTASMSIPFIFPYVTISKKKYVDGGWVKNFAIDAWGDAENVLGLYFGATVKPAKKIPWWRPVKRLIEYVVRLTNLAIVQNMQESMEDMKNATFIELISAGEGLSFNLSEKEIDNMIKEGYLSVDKYLKTNGITHE